MISVIGVRKRETVDNAVDRIGWGTNHPYESRISEIVIRVNGFIEGEA